MPTLRNTRAARASPATGRQRRDSSFPFGKSSGNRMSSGTPPRTHTHTENQAIVSPPPNNPPGSANSV